MVTAIPHADQIRELLRQVWKLSEQDLAATAEFAATSDLAKIPSYREKLDAATAALEALQHLTRVAAECLNPATDPETTICYGQIVDDAFHWITTPDAKYRFYDSHAHKAYETIQELQAAASTTATPPQKSAP